MTGPTYPVRGKVILGDNEIRYKLLRSHEITSDCEIGIKAASSAISGRVLYQRFKTADPWTEIFFSRQGDRLVAMLPKQPMAGKLAYKAYLSFQGKEVSLSCVGDVRGHAFLHLRRYCRPNSQARRAEICALDGGSSLCGRIHPGTSCPEIRFWGLVDGVPVGL
jgi:hypothetical protein